MLLQTLPLASLFSSARTPLGQFVFDEPVEGEAGPAPAPAAAPAPRRGPGGIGGALSKLFTGGFNPDISDEANSEARSAGLIRSGLTALLSREPGGLGLAEGALAGQAEGTAVRQQEVQRLALAEAEAQRSQIIGESDFGTTEGRTAAVQQLLAAGLSDEAQKVIGLMGQFAQPQVLTEGDQIRVIDPNDGSIIETGIALASPPEDTTWQQVGDELQLLSDVDGRMITTISNPERMSQSEIQSIMMDRFSRATTLRNSFRSDTQELQGALLQANNVLSVVPSLDLVPEDGLDAAQGNTLVIGFNKMLDAASVVREGEFDRVANIGGVRANIQRWQNQISKDGRLPRESVVQVLNEVNRLEGLMQGAVNRVARQHTQTARDFQVNPEHVLSGVAVDPFIDLGG